MFGCGTGGCQQVVAFFVYNSLELLFGNLHDGELVLDVSAKAYGVVFNPHQFCALACPRKELHIDEYPFGIGEGGG
jgi:hypothetical protein